MTEIKEAPVQEKIVHDHEMSADVFRQIEEYLNPLRICRITYKNQYYLRHSHSISGDRIMGFDMNDDYYFVTGCSEKNFNRIHQLDESEQFAAIKKVCTTIARIPMTQEMMIDYYATQRNDI